MLQAVPGVTTVQRMAESPGAVTTYHVGVSSADVTESLFAMLVGHGFGVLGVPEKPEDLEAVLLKLTTARRTP